jgi:O-acetyl-ADP-ribose deacetylase (regulator of RNase III)
MKWPKKNGLVFPMIELTAEAEASVNAVNTVGVMGKGIALTFKVAFLENFRAYAKACKRKEVKVGHMFVTERRALIGPKWIINFSTKEVLAR